jgi:hypothetical protein
MPPLTPDDCDKWEKNKNKHPVSGKGLTKGKVPYKNVELECNALKNLEEDSIEEIKKSIEKKLEGYKISDELPTINKLRTTVILANNPAIVKFLNDLVSDILRTMILWIDHMIVPQIISSTKCVECERKGEKTIPFSRFWNNVQDGHYRYCDLHKQANTFFSFRPNFGIIEVDNEGKIISSNIEQLDFTSRMMKYLLTYILPYGTILNKSLLNKEQIITMIDTKKEIKGDRTYISDINSFFSDKQIDDLIDSLSENQKGRIKKLTNGSLSLVEKSLEGIKTEQKDKYSQDEYIFKSGEEFHQETFGDVLRDFLTKTVSLFIHDKKFNIHITYYNGPLKGLNNLEYTKDTLQDIFNINKNIVYNGIVDNTVHTQLIKTFFWLITSVTDWLKKKNMDIYDVLFAASILLKNPTQTFSITYPDFLLTETHENEAKLRKQIEDSCDEYNLYFDKNSIDRLIVIFASCINEHGDIDTNIIDEKKISQFYNPRF